VHGALVDVLVVLAVVTLWVLVRTRAPRCVVVTASVALAAMMVTSLFRMASGP